MASEFELIGRYFTRPARRAQLGVGDDCALIEAAPGMTLAVSTDLLVAGTHFFPDTDARRLGHKTLAVNLSDLAAMGATPRYATLTMSLPQADEAWLAAFAAGFFALADLHGVELIGGDTTRGPLTLGVTIMGEVPHDAAIRRSGARAGDDVWVSGTLGDAALGLAFLRGASALDQPSARFCVERLEAPTPRVTLGLQLAGIATAMIDVSDGLGGDLAHVARASAVTATLRASDLPLSFALAGLPPDEALRLALGGGDDYELCFTAPPALRAAVERAGQAAQVRLTRIGSIDADATPDRALRLVGADGQDMPLAPGFDHFAVRT
ncbi:MAG: thiamine-phosphate kinase [Burkholderiales bacterium]|nr:thiamine-phosphate kinase [Burkholderiales bacterium]